MNNHTDNQDSYYFTRNKKKYRVSKKRISYNYTTKQQTYNDRKLDKNNNGYLMLENCIISNGNVSFCNPIKEEIKPKENEFNFSNYLPRNRVKKGKSYNWNGDGYSTGYGSNFGNSTASSASCSGEVSHSCMEINTMF